MIGNLHSRKVGKTDLNISSLGMGTVELGMDYGINVPGENGKPESNDAINLLNRAYSEGIHFFDTAPSYGCSERIIGEAFGDLGSKKPVIATKINIPPEGFDADGYVEKSIMDSCRELSTDILDVVQIHNAASETFQSSDFFTSLLNMKDAGRVKYLGASVYEPENAIAAIDSKEIDLIQVAYNIIDQRMSDEVFLEAHKKGIGVVCRSVYFRGVLTQRAQYLPESCSFLKEIAYKIKNEMNFSSWDELSAYALRFALSNPNIDCVLVGVKNIQELQFALDIWKNSVCLSEGELELATSCRVDDPFWLDPSNWGIS